MSKKKKAKKIAEDACLEAGKLMTSKQVTSCNAIIHTASVACAACGVIPIPIADAAPMSAAQVTMVLSLGKVFDIELTESAAKSILTGAAGISNQNSQLNLKWIQLVEELLSSSDQKELIK